MNRLEQIEAIAANPLFGATVPQPLPDALHDLLAVAKAAVALDSCPGAGSLELHEALAPLLEEVAN